MNIRCTFGGIYHAPFPRHSRDLEHFPLVRELSKSLGGSFVYGPQDNAFAGARAVGATSSYTRVSAGGACLKQKPIPAILLVNS